MLYIIEWIYKLKGNLGVEIMVVKVMIKEMLLKIEKK